jgi:hypothetical protein
MADASAPQLAAQRSGLDRRRSERGEHGIVPGEGSGHRTRIEQVALHHGQAFAPMGDLVRRSDVCGQFVAAFQADSQEVLTDPAGGAENEQAHGSPPVKSFSFRAAAARANRRQMPRALAPRSAPTDRDAIDRHRAAGGGTRSNPPPRGEATATRSRG